MKINLRMNNNRISPFAKPFIPKTIKTNVIQLKFNKPKKIESKIQNKEPKNKIENNKENKLYNGLYTLDDPVYNYILNIFRPIN